MDLEALDTNKGANQGARLDVKHPTTGELIGASINLLGADSDAWREKMVDLQRRQMDRIRRNPKYRRTPEEIEADSIDLLAAVTTGWDLEIGGQKPAFSAAEAQKIYTRFAWIREQVDEFVAERSNFLPHAASV